MAAGKYTCNRLAPCLATAIDIQLMSTTGFHPSDGIHNELDDYAKMTIYFNSANRNISSTNQQDSSYKADLDFLDMFSV